MIVSLINITYNVIQVLILLRMVFSWMMPYGATTDFAKLIYQITELMLKPFRVIVPIGNMGGIDIAPIILLVLLNIVRKGLILLVV